MDSDLALIRYSLRCNDFYSAADIANKALLKSHSQNQHKSGTRTGTRINSNIGGTNSINRRNRNLNERERGILLFWKTCAKGLCSGEYDDGHDGEDEDEGAIKDCILGLEGMRKQFRLLDYAIITALIWFRQQHHEQQQQQQKQERERDLEQKYDAGYHDDELKKLHLASKVALNCIHADGAFLAADFHLFVGRNPLGAQRCVKSLSLEVTKTMRNSIPAGQLKIGRQQLNRINLWSLVSSCDIDNGPNVDGEGHYLDRNESEHKIDLDTSEDDIDSLMAKAKYYALVGKAEDAVDTLSEIIAIDKSFFPAFVERANVYLSLKEYILAEESAQHSVAIGSGHIESLRVLSLVQYLTNHDKTKRLGHFSLLRSKMGEGTENEATAISTNKTKLKVAKLFSRVCGNDRETLELTLKSVSRISELEIDNWDIRMEFARQLRKLGKFEKAIQQYQFASDIEPDNVETLQNMILCQVLSGSIEEAKHQVEFVELMQEDANTIVHTEMVFAQLLMNDRSNTLQAIQLGKELVQHLFNIARSSSFQYDSFDLGLANDIVHHIFGTCLFGTSQHPSTALPNDLENAKADLSQTMCNLLEVMSHRYPSNCTASALLTKTKYESGDLEGAELIIRDTPTENVLVIMMKAQIQLSNSQSFNAKQSLEQALSQDFTLTQHPFFCLIKGSVCVEEGEYETARENLFQVLAFDADTTEVNQFHLSLISPRDKIDCFMQLAKALKRLNDEEGISKLLCLANEAFSNEQEFHYLKFRSDLYLDSGNIAKALDLYDQVPTRSVNYDTAQRSKADIYLNYQSNQKEYLTCYQNILVANETSEAHRKLGVAYMQIKSPVEAIAAFKSALELEPKKEELAISLGSALIDSHEYKLAIDHYEQYLLSNPDAHDVRLTLGTLYFDLQYHQDAIDTFEPLARRIFSDRKKRSLTILAALKLSEIYYITEKYDMGINILSAARTQQLEILEEQRIVESTLLDQSGKIYAEIMLKLSYHYGKQKEVNSAVDTAHESLRFEKNDALRIHIAVQLYNDNQFESAAKQCEYLLESNKNDEDAISLLCEVLMKQSKSNEVFRFLKEFIINANSKCYKIIFKYILLLTRLGNQDDIIKICDELDRDKGKMFKNLGHSLCQGLCRRWLGDPIEALKYFNIARQGKEWSQMAYINMLEIYLRVDDFDFWSSSQNKIQVSEKSVNSVDYLFRGIEMKTTKVLVLKGYWEILRALKSGKFDNPTKCFQDVLNNEKDHIPSLLGTAIISSFSATKTKVRNRLKKIAKTPHQFDYLAEYETSYLMLAHDYIERNKIELARDLCKRCLFYSKSSAKAWELLGITFELQDGYDSDAIDCYENLSQYTMYPGSYQRLALLYLKLGRHQQAMESALNYQNLVPDDTISINELQLECLSVLKP